MARIYRRTVQKNLNDPDNHDGVDTPRARHPGVLSQGALGSITMNKDSGDDGIPAELFQIIFFSHSTYKWYHVICISLSGLLHLV